MKLHKFAVLFILLTALFSFPSFVSSNSVTENNSPNDGDWQQLNPANAPDARFGHSLVTMPDGRGILFGGEHQPGELFDDLHIFEQDQWSMVTPVGDSPPARRAHSRWVRGDIMFIYGGKNADGLLAELYSYSPDAKQWSLIVPNNDPPAARYGAQSWEYDDLLYMMGGKDENDLDCEEVFVFNPDTGEWETKMSQINAFPVSSLNVVGVHQDTAYILGSSDEVIVKYDLPNNTMELDYPNGTTPEARLGSAFTQSETTAWLFGGKDGSTVMGDAYAFDFATETYTRLPDMPFALYQAAAAFDGNEVVVYGGVKADGSLNDTTFLLTVVNTNWSPGSKDTGFANVSANGTIKDVARQHDGKYIVVGDFTQVNGVTRNRIARFHSDGSLDTSFNPPDTPNDIVNAVAIAPDGKIIIGGKFNQVGSSSELQNLAMFNPDGSIDPDFHPPIQEKTDATINDIDILNEKTILGADSYSIYVGGNLTYNISHLNYSISQIAHLHNRGWLHNSLKNDDNGVEIDGVVNVIDAAKDIGVLIGGDFTHVNGEGRNGMAHLFFDGTLSSNFATGTGANGAVNDMAQLSNGKTIVVGDFTQYDSNPRNG
ncbi:MAG: kelch repeat-containing protein, partial [Chloroflexota bacterium]